MIPNWYRFRQGPWLPGTNRRRPMGERISGAFDCGCNGCVRASRGELDPVRAKGLVARANGIILRTALHARAAVTRRPETAILGNRREGACAL